MDSQNQILITLDSCRWDTFEKAAVPFMKSFPHRRCFTNATYTLPAHQSFFIGKLPHNFGGEENFDTAARFRRGSKFKIPQWRLADGTNEKKGRFVLHGSNIVEGFARVGYTTIGTGAMRWFDPDCAATFSLTRGFEHYKYFRNQINTGTNLTKQLEWILATLKGVSQKPYFLFLNVGETHQPYEAEGHSFSGYWGDAAACARAQRASLEWIDTRLAEFFSSLSNCHAVICGDHGDCWGEDGLWGHGFYHPKLMVVPMTIIEKGAH